MAPTTSLHTGDSLLDELLSLSHRDRALRFAALGLPAFAGAGDDPDPDPDPEPDPDPNPDGGKPDPDPEPDPDHKPDAEPDPDPEPHGGVDWKAMSRKHERRAKQEREAREKLEQRLKELEDQGKSEQEKALEQARQEAAAEVEARYQAEIRRDRLETAVVRLASKGVKVGEGDKAKTLRFDDPEDALVFIERELDRGELDPDDVYDEQGRVKPEAITEALADLLARKPKLAADDGAGRAKPQGGADAGRGRGGGKSLDDWSPDDHLKAVQKR